MKMNLESLKKCIENNNKEHNLNYSNEEIEQLAEWLILLADVYVDSIIEKRL